MSEEVNIHINTTDRRETFPVIEQFSSYSKLCRVVAFCLRFIYNCKHPDSRRSGSLTAKEIKTATICIVKLIQKTEFSSELKVLQKNQSLPPSSKFLPLNIFLDDQGLIRVGGRLSRHQTFSEDQKHPILIPKKHIFTELVIRHYHSQHFHAGPQLVLSLIRQIYWFVNGRSVVKRFYMNASYANG